MTPLKVLDIDWAKIRELQLRQDYHAHALGVCVATNRKKMIPLVLEKQPTREQLETIGILQVQIEREIQFWLDKMNSVEELQLAAGEQALLAVGIDTSKVKTDFTILEGVVHRLVDGTYVPEMR
jgi:hypothetical protein